MAVAPTTDQAPRSMMRGISLKILSALAFTVMSATIKLAGTPDPVAGTHLYPIGQVVFCRSFFALIPVYVWLFFEHDLGAATRTNNVLGHMRRGMIGSTGMFCGFTATALLPLSDATAIGYAAPLITVVLAALVLKETVRAYRWTAVCIGLAGVIVMLWPYLANGVILHGLGDGEARGVIFGLFGAFCSAFATIEVRRLTGSENTAAIVFYFMLLCTGLGLLTGIAGIFWPAMRWTIPGLYDATLLVTIGLLGGIGQITMTQSFRHADASIIASFDYMSMIWAVAIGWYLFGELPQSLVVIGACIVVCSGIFVIWRERQLGIRREKQQSVASSRAI